MLYMYDFLLHKCLQLYSIRDVKRFLIDPFIKFVIAEELSYFSQG